MGIKVALLGIGLLLWGILLVIAGFGTAGLISGGVGIILVFYEAVRWDERNEGREIYQDQD